MKALILAAGEGIRLRPLTLDRPKPMVPVGGRPVLEHLVGLLRHHKITRIAINLHYKPETIVDYFGDGSRFGVAIEYSWEPTLLGTAGAAKQLDWFLTEPFVVLYGDVLTTIDLGQLAHAHAVHGAFASLALYEPDDLTRCGVAELAPDLRVVGFVEKPTHAVPGGLASAGVCVFEPDVLGYVPAGRACDFGTDVIPELITRGLPVYGYVGRGYILDVGSAVRYAQAEADFREGRFVSPLDMPSLAASCAWVGRC